MASSRSIIVGEHKLAIQYHPIIFSAHLQWIQIISLPRLPDSSTGLGIPSTMPVFSPSEGVLHFQLHVCRVNILRINSLNPWTLTYLNTLMSSCTSSNSSKWKGPSLYIEASLFRQFRGSSCTYLLQYQLLPISIFYEPYTLVYTQNIIVYIYNNWLWLYMYIYVCVGIHIDMLIYIYRYRHIYNSILCIHVCMCIYIVFFLWFIWTLLLIPVSGCCMVEPAAQNLCAGRSVELRICVPEPKKNTNIYATPPPVPTFSLCWQCGFHQMSALFW